jgi:hypothetical protein
LATSTYTVTGTTTGCSGTASQTITVSPTPTVTVSPVASTICSGNTTTITASGATTYTWSPSTGLSASTGATVTFSGTTTSTYTVTGTSAGCSATASQTITVNTTPTVTLTPVAATICSGNNTNMTASGATTYTWSPSVGLSASTGATVTFSGTATSTYTVTGTSTGCSATASQIITVNPVPVLTVTPSSTSICNGSVVTASGASTYSWAPATGLSAATGASVTVVASSATIYTITGTNTFGCIATATKSVAITAPPVIAAVSPMVGYPSSSVTISGSNFDTVANNNIVYFGATRASVVSSGSSTNLLSVTVPAGATYMPVSLLDSSTCGLSAASIAPYLPSYNDSGYDPSVIRYNSAISLSSGGNSVTVADLDGDGKSDLIVPVWASSGYINVYRNISSAGTLSSGSFASPVSFSLGTYTNIAAVGDLDGDGKPDIAVTNSGSNTVSVLRNISSPGSLTSGSFAAPVNFATGNGLTWVSICDFDGDGKPDLAVSEISDSKVGIFRNTSTRGSITTSSFSAKVSFATGLNPRTVAIGDIDGDGKPDMAISNEGGGSVSLFRNTCTPGTLDISSFAAKVDFSTGTSSVPYSVAIADLDGDNKPDVSVVVSARDSLFVFRNTATSGTITSGSLAAPVKFATGGAPRSLSVGDVNGDGKPDVVVANTSGVTVSVLRNTGAGSGISSSTFATKVDFTAGTGVISNVLADMNGDGMPEIVAPYGSGVNIFQNNPLHSITNAGPVCTGSTRPLANATAGGTWSSSASGVATISATGVVTGVSVGSANISYTVSGFRTTALVTVNTTPTITVTPVDSTICSGNTTAITASGATTYTWLPSTGLSATTGATVTCNATATTTYTITGTTGCSVTAMRTITVNSVPTITVTPSSANICMGSSVSLTASGATTYSWSPTTGLSSAVGASVTASPTVTGTYVVTGSASGCSSTRSVSINVSTQPTASISAAPFPCDGASVNVVFTGTAGDTLHYAVDSGSFVTAVLTGSTYTIATGVVTVPRSYWLHSANNLACVVTIDTSVVLTPAPNTWLGSTSADWSTTANWLCGSVPVATQNVLIPAGTTYLPVAGTSAIIYARDITIDTAVLVTLQTGAVLNIKGDLTSSGTIAGPGNVKLNAASAQRIAGKSAISNLELENSAGATISAASKLTIKQVLTITSGTLNTNDSLVLYSDSSATARVAPIPASGAAIAGNVQVMQYIQGGMRRYRFWSHPFSNYTGLSQVQNYIDVTGTGGAANGFTTTTSNAASAFRYDPVSGNSTLGYDPGWKPFVSAATSVDSNRIHRYQGIRLFFRGAKGEGLGFGTYTPTAATVKQWGTLNQGSQTVLLSKGATINQDYNMIGNPYASPVDIGTVLYDARVAGNISGSAFYVWNPNLGAAGQFQAITIGSTSASPYYLPANCAFQVRAAHNGDSLNFTENHKGAASTTVLHRDMGNGIELAIYDADHHPWDMLRIGFDNSATDGEDNSDARKLNGPDFNFYSVAADGVKLAVDARPFCSSARIPLGVSSHNARAFVIKAELLRLPADEAVYLHDKYAGTYTLLQQGDEYKFSITEDKATQGYRFELGAGPSNVSNLLRVTLNPNPATDKVAVQYTGSIAGAVTVNITDVTGQLVASRQATGTAGSVHIPIGHLAAGVYMVEVAAGNQKNVQRLVIQ